MNIKQSRSWMGTVSFEAHDEEDMKKKLKNYSYIAQLEMGESGYVHWQLYVENETPIKFQTMKNKFPTGHFEQRKGTRRQAYEYCQKLDTAQGVTISAGEIDLEAESETSDLKSMREDIVLLGKSVDEVVLTNATAWRYAKHLHELKASVMRAQQGKKLRAVTTDYIWGKTGVGKTHKVYETHGFDDIFVVSSYGSGAFDGYTGESVIVLDEFKGQVDFQMLLKLLDKFPFELPARFANKQAFFTKVYILSNYPLTDHYRDMQENNAEGWKAFLRRVTTNNQMLPGGELVDDSPKVEDVEFADIIRAINEDVQENAIKE